MSEVTVITGALHEEAKKWRQLSDETRSVTTAAVSLALTESAFFIGDANTQMHSLVYNEFQSFMVRVLSGAVTEFEQLGGALDRMADAYDDADKVVSLDLDSIYAE